jgi:hypothetical protein
MIILLHFWICFLSAVLLVLCEQRSVYCLSIGGVAGQIMSVSLRPIVSAACKKWMCRLDGALESARCAQQVMHNCQRLCQLLCRALLAICPACDCMEAMDVSARPAAEGC